MLSVSFAAAGRMQNKDEHVDGGAESTSSVPPSEFTDWACYADEEIMKQQDEIRVLESEKISFVGDKVNATSLTLLGRLFFNCCKRLPLCFSLRCRQHEDWEFADVSTAVIILAQQQEDLTYPYFNDLPFQISTFLFCFVLHFYHNCIIQNSSYIFYQLDCISLPGCN